MSFVINLFEDDSAETLTEGKQEEIKSESKFSDENDDAVNSKVTITSNSFKQKYKQKKQNMNKKKWLVELIKKEELVWNKQNNMHWNPKSMSAAWKRIAAGMPDATTAEECRIMWKSLRDALRYQLKVDKQRNSLNEGVEESELRSMLHFLIPQANSEVPRRPPKKTPPVKSYRPRVLIEPVVDESELHVHNSVKVNLKQKNIIFDAMSRDREILEGRTFEGRDRRNELWENLATKLNIYGPAKDISQWKKCWSDLRLSMRKKYEQRKQSKDKRYGFSDYERHVIKACGMKFSDDDEFFDSETDGSGEVEVVEEDAHTYVKAEHGDNIVPIGFEIVDLQSEIITSDQEFINGNIKTEDTPECSMDTMSETESLHLLSESPSHEMQSTHNFQADHLNAPGIEYFPDEAIIEIRKMHRNLLTESQKQTALLRQIVDRLSR